MRKQAEGGLVVVVSDRTEIQGDRWGGADVVRFPFPTTWTSRRRSSRQIQGAVAAVQAHWRAKPGTAVLVHCQAGQNRSGAVVLAAARVRRARSRGGAHHGRGLEHASGVLWGKLLGENGQRMRAGAWRTAVAEWDDADASVTAADLLIGRLLRFGSRRARAHA